MYDGIYSKYRNRTHGRPAGQVPQHRFFGYIQNHDQVANTSQGARLSHLVSLEQYKIAVALLLCSPCLPLLFMGEEFAETNPFLYFTSHGDPTLARLVSEGRCREFEEFTVASAFVDPQTHEAFERSKITWDLLKGPAHQQVLNLYRELIALRKCWPCLNNGRKDLTRVEFSDDERWLRMERADPSGSSAGSRAVLFCNFSETNRPLELGSDWTLALTTAPWAGGPCSASLYLAKG